MRFNLVSAVMLTTATLAAAPAAAAEDVFVDRLSDSYDAIDLANIFTKMNDCGCFPGFNSTVVDQFTLSSTSRITTVKVALLAIQQNPTSNFTGFADAQAYQMNIYSSAAKAAASLAGDVYSLTIDPSQVAFGSSFAVTGDSAAYVPATSLATFTLDAKLAAGSYWFSVTGINDPDENESIGVALSGTGVAKFVNPGGAFEMPGNSMELGKNLGFALSGAANVPEPASWAMMIAGFALAGSAVRRRARPILAHSVA